MIYPEEEYLQLSGLQHFAFCRRQWALIHIEQQWKENLRTVEGDLFHQRAHDEHTREKRGNTLILRGLPVISHRLGLSGKCDVVEFHADEKRRFVGWRSRLMDSLSCRVQNEERLSLMMLIFFSFAHRLSVWKKCFAVVYPQGALFNGESRRRVEVDFTEDCANGSNRWQRRCIPFIQKGIPPE